MHEQHEPPPRHAMKATSPPTSPLCLTSSLATLPKLLVLCCFASLLAEEAQAQHPLRLPPLTKADPLADGVCIRSIELPPRATNDDNRGENKHAGEGTLDGAFGVGDGGVYGGSGGSKSRRRLIMYDFRPAFPPYTKESLDDLLLFPNDPVASADEKGVMTRLEEEEVADREELEERCERGPPPGDGGGTGVADDHGDGGRGPLQDEALDEKSLEAAVEEVGAPAEKEGKKDDSSTSSTDETHLEKLSIDPVPLEQVDATTKEQQPPNSLEGQPKESEGNFEIKSTNVVLSEMDRTPLEIKLVAADANLETFDKDADLASGQENEVKETGVKDVETPKVDVLLADDGDKHGGVDSPTSTVEEEGGYQESEPELLDTSSKQAQHQIQEQMAETTIQSHATTKESSGNFEVESEQLSKEVASDDLGEDYMPNASEGTLAEKAVSPNETGFLNSASEETEGGNVMPSETTTDTAADFDSERTEEDAAETDEVVADTESATDNLQKGEDVLKEDEPHGKESRPNDGTAVLPETMTIGAQREEKITVQYDDDALKTAQSSTSSATSSTTTNNRDANRQFVTGLDEIDKLFESVEVPDELDVGADGSSMQDVLVGQGLKILWKRVGNFGRGVKGKFDNVAGSVRGAVRGAVTLGGLLAEEEEEEDLTLESLLDLDKLNEDRSSMLDKEDETMEGATPKRDGGRFNKSKKEKKIPTKEKKNGHFPLVRTRQAQQIWKFARRKWEQAKLILDDLLHIFEGADIDGEDGGFSLEDMKKLGKGEGGGLLEGEGRVEMVPNFDGKFGSEVDQSFLKSRYEAMMKQQQQQEKKQ